MPSTNPDSNRRKLLYIVTRNISGLDYMVAVLWRLRTQYPNVDITVFFAEPHYDHVLRGGRFFLELFDSLGIEYKDFRDLLHPFTKSLMTLVNPLLVLPPINYTTPMWIQRLQYLLNRFMLSEKRFAEFLNTYESDCIIIDDRKYYLQPFCGYKELQAYYDAHPTLPIIQIPHAMKSEYYGDLFPNGRLCEIWLPLVAKENSHLAIRDLEHVYQTFVPSLDTKWLTFLKSSDLGMMLPPDHLSCVVLLEPFERLRDVHYKRDPQTNPKQFSFEQMQGYLESLAGVEKRLAKKLYLVIKPHPKQDIYILTKILKVVGLRNYCIVWETNHHLFNVDLCVSMLTTAVYPFLVAKVPTVIFVTHIIKIMPLPELYTNLTYAGSTSDEIVSAVDEILTKGHQDIERDYQHIRTYLPDHALDTVMNRLELHLHLNNQSEEIKGISA